jgi:hypothetical protein
MHPSRRHKGTTGHEVSTPAPGSPGPPLLSPQDLGRVPTPSPMLAAAAAPAPKARHVLPSSQALSGGGPTPSVHPGRTYRAPSVGFALPPNAAGEPSGGRDRAPSVSTQNTFYTEATEGTAGGGGSSSRPVKKEADILSPNQTGFSQFLFNYVNDRLLAYMYTSVQREEWAGPQAHLNTEPDMSQLEATQASQACDQPQQGIIAALEEESHLSRGTDARFVSQVLRTFRDSKTAHSSSSFQLHHGYGEVAYESTGFVSANRRPVRLELSLTRT